MVMVYEIAGRKVGSHVLAIATLSTVFLGTAYATRGSPKEASKTPPIKASSKDEENFIQEFLLREGADGKAKHG